MGLVENLKRIYERLLAGKPPSARRPAIRKLVRLLEVEAERRQVPVEMLAKQMEASLRSPKARRRRRALSLWRTLTPREQQVALLLRRGYTNTHIARILTISPETVRTHISSIQKKWDAPSKVALRRALTDLPVRRSLSKKRGSLS